MSNKPGAVPCSLLCVLFRGQLASTSSATQVRLFLPCSLNVQSSRDRSRALLVSSPTLLQAGILQEETMTLLIRSMSRTLLDLADITLESFTLVDKLHDCCHLLPLGLLGLGSPCGTASQKETTGSVTAVACFWGLPYNLPAVTHTS